MSQLLVDDIVNRSDGPPGFSKGLVVTGIATATDFSGVGGGAADFPNGLTGIAATFSGNVSIGGTLTYEDVTNIDSVGIITARAGVKVTAGGVNVVGCGTYTTGVDLQGFKVEEFKLETSTGLNGEFDFLLEDGHLQRFTTATGGNYFPDFKVSSTVSLNSIMDVGDAITTVLVVASSSHYCTTGMKIDNSVSNIDLDWVGGAAPSAANGSGYDIYSFTIMKVNPTPVWHVIANTLGAA